jgi:RsiW-degrading membrane proteinase PrsW (M82 family)
VLANGLIAVLMVLALVGVAIALSDPAAPERFSYVAALLLIGGAAAVSFLALILNRPSSRPSVDAAIFD